MPPLEPQPTPRSSARAVLAILAVTVAWGWTFVWMKQAVEASDRILGPEALTAGVGLFMTLRFGLAALILACLPVSRRGLDRGSWFGGAWIGLLLYGGFLLQMLGLAGVSAPVSAFLTSLYVLFTAVLLWLRTRRRIGSFLAAGALLATFGAGFISGPPQVEFGLAEALTIGCALIFAAHILATDSMTKAHAPLAVTLSSFVAVTILSAATTAFASLEAESTIGQLVGLAGQADFVRPLLLASIIATVGALSLMNLFQRELDPVRAAILYALEPIWAALIAVGLGTTRPDRWLFLGGAALLAGNLIAELGPLLRPRRAAAPAS